MSPSSVSASNPSASRPMGASVAAIHAAAAATCLLLAACDRAQIEQVVNPTARTTPSQPAIRVAHQLPEGWVPAANGPAMHGVAAYAIPGGGRVATLSIMGDMPDGDLLVIASATAQLDDAGKAAMLAAARTETLGGKSFQLFHAAATPAALAAGGPATVDAAIHRTATFTTLALLTLPSGADTPARLAEFREFLASQESSGQ